MRVEDCLLQGRFIQIHQGFAKQNTFRYFSNIPRINIHKDTMKLVRCEISGNIIYNIVHSVVDVKAYTGRALHNQPFESFTC